MSKILTAADPLDLYMSEEIMHMKEYYDNKDRRLKADVLSLLS
jgi:hypothetical protein